MCPCFTERLRLQTRRNDDACGDDLVCAKCGVRIVSGRVAREAPIERRAKARNRVSPELRLACALRVQGNLVLTAEYW